MTLVLQKPPPAGRRAGAAGRSMVVLAGAILAAASTVGAGDAVAIGDAPTPTVPPVLVVVVPKDSALDNISLVDLRRIFLAQTEHDPRGDRVVPINQSPESPERLLFERAVLGMSKDEAGRYWIDRKIRGQGSAPRALPSATVIQRLVARLPGTIAYVRSDRLEAGVKVLRIDGVLWTDPRYPLRGMAVGGT